MKTRRIRRSRWPFGILLVSLLIICYTCTNKQSPNSPSDENNLSETPALTAFSDSLITAFSSENEDDVLALVRSEYRATCDAELNGTRNTMTAVAQALKKRQLLFANALYAEYKVSIDGTAFRIAYSNCGDGHWQLIRF